jgi:branched-chain amino acid transport system ATP-binding protein
MNETLLLQTQDIHSSYDNKSQVLQGVSIDFHGGGYAIVGRNGMGKSTLVKTIMGLVPTLKGKIYFKGEDITNLKPYEIGSRRIGYVPQGRELFRSLSVHEHFLLAARGGNSHYWSIERVYELFPRLRERSKQGAATLSGGEQQMLAIGRALVTNPTLLIMDEPSEGLAPVILDILIATYHSLLETGISILMVEQNLRTAAALSNELYVMVSGKIVSKVGSEEFLKDKSLREKYLGVKV